MTCILAVALLVAGVWVGGLHSIPPDTSEPQQLPVPNAYDTWAAAYSAYVPPPTPGIDEVNDPAVTSKLVNGRYVTTTIYSPVRREAWLRRNAGCLALLRQGLKQQYLQPRPAGYSALIGPSAAHLREMARMLAIESHARALRADWGAAADSGLDCIELGTRSTNGGALMGEVVGAAINAIGYDALWKAIPHLNAADTTRTLTRLTAIDAEREPYSETLREEKADWRRQFIGYMGAGLFTAKYFLGDESVMGRLRWTLVNYSQIIADHDQLSDHLIALADRPTGAIVTPPPPACSVSDPYNCYATTAQGERFDFLNNARTKANGKLLIGLLALRQYQLAHGHYPSSLSDLPAETTKVLAIDPFGTGGPFHYRRTGASYLLYSVGPNGVDDHGQIDRAASFNLVDHSPHHWLKSLDCGGDMVAIAN